MANFEIKDYSKKIEINGQEFSIEIGDAAYYAEIMKLFEKTKTITQEISESKGDMAEKILDFAEFLQKATDFILCEENACEKILGNKFKSLQNRIDLIAFLSDEIAKINNESAAAALADSEPVK